MLLRMNLSLLTARTAARPAMVRLLWAAFLTALSLSAAQPEAATVGVPFDL